MANATARTIFYFATATVFLSLAVSCSSAPKTVDSDTTDPQMSSTDEQIFVGDTMEMNYDPNVIMKRAESFFEKEAFPEAIVEYEHFLDLHSTHTLAPYAQYKLALSHFMLIKTIDRDPEPIHQALDAFQKLLEEHPKSRYVGEAQERIRTCRDLLAKHNILVGEFYFRKEAYLAAAHRFEKVIDTYPELETTANAMYELALTYKEMGADDWAKQQLVALVNKYPYHKARKQGLTLLAKLEPEHPTLVAANNEPALPENIPINSLNQNETKNLQASSSPPQVTKVALAPATPQVNGYQQSTNANNPHVEVCSLGVWCESDYPVMKPAPAPALPSDGATICQPGRWC